MKHPRRLAAILFVLLLSSIPASAEKGKYAAAPSNYEMIEAPTAYTLLHGGYDVIMRLYEGGGLFLRGNIGFHDRFMFGFSGNATNVVGHGHIEVQEPRLAVKWKVLSQDRFPVALAIAWDDRGYGESVGRRFTPGLQKGLYAAVSREIQKPAFLQFHGGVNVVRFADFESDRDLGLFGGMVLAFSNSFHVALELDKLLSDQWQLNSGFMLAFDEPVQIGMDFRDLNRREAFARILRIQYLSFF